MSEELNKEVKSVEETQLEKSLAALDRAIKKLGKEKIDAIIAKVDAMNIPGPTVDEYMQMLEDYHSKKDKL